MIVKKSDGRSEDFDSLKAKKGIIEACLSAKETPNNLLIENIINSLYLYDNIESKEIRRQIEEALMSINKGIAKEYINKFNIINENNKQLTKKTNFINNYINASNPATGSKFDSNANVTTKNIVTMGQELYKDNNIRQNRYMLCDKIKSGYSKKLADMYISDIESHRIYKHDETAIPGMPYCVAITMYPFLINGLKDLGGISTAPTDLKSFCGEFINLVYSISSQFAGAVATPEYLMYMDYFIRKDYGNNYLDKLSNAVDGSVKNRTLEKTIENCFQQVVHSMNMPAGNRGYQTVFWNVSYFDKFYFKGIFEDFLFPDGTKPIWETLSWLQKKFMKWFNGERSKYVLTFPVETLAMLTDDKDILDTDYADFASEMWSEGHSFFCYLSDSPDSLSSCCRLRNSIKDFDLEHNHTTHQFSMGTASIATGSKSVMTINLNQIIQDAINEKLRLSESNLDANKYYNANEHEADTAIIDGVTKITERIQKYQNCFNDIIKDFYKANMLNVYSAGFIDMKRQYLTIGVNGLTDAAEYLGIEVSNNEIYKKFVNIILETINKCNAKAKTKELMYNTEFVPAENLSVKNYNWNKNNEYFVSTKHDMYSSYFFNPEDNSLTILDKMKMHGKEFVKYLDGGSACHINIQEHMSKDQYRQLLKIAVMYGTNYFTFNCKNTVCNSCGFISKDTLDVCPKCGSKDLDYLTRIIGYLKRVSNFSEYRQKEENNRVYNKISNIL
jgi:ribonucleoside-triphosphate reductase (formate)